MARFYGIDLGTTNTVFYCGSFIPGDDEEGYSLTAQSFISDVSKARLGTSMPSALYIRDPEDDLKRKLVVGEDALANRWTGGRNTLFLLNTKREMGQDVDFGYGITPLKVAIAFLEKCYQSMKRPSLAKVCITRPASYNIFASADTTRAGEQAGFNPKNISALDEPKAALLSYLYDCMENEAEREDIFQKQEENQGMLTFLIIDIGGGTTDVNVQSLRVGTVSEEQKDLTIYSNYAVEFINRTGEKRSSANNYHGFGGMDFDSKVARHLMKTLVNKYRDEMNGDLMQLSEKELNEVRDKVIAGAERYKMKLSLCLPENVDTYQDDILLTDLYKGWSPTISLKASDYFSIVADLCDNTMVDDSSSELSIYSIVYETLKKSGYKVTDLSFVLVTGGMSQCLPVKLMLQEKFETIKSKIVFSHTPLTDVARGAAVFGNYFHMTKPAAILNTNYYIDNPEGEPLLIAEDGDELPIPTDLKKGFLELHSPVSITIAILAGRSIYDSNLREVAKMRGVLEYPDDRGTKVDVRYSIADDQSMTLDVIIPHKHHESEVITVTRSLDEVNSGREE